MKAVPIAIGAAAVAVAGFATALVLWLGGASALAVKPRVPPGPVVVMMFTAAARRDIASR